MANYSIKSISVIDFIDVPDKASKVPFPQPSFALITAREISELTFLGSPAESNTSAGNCSFTPQSCVHACGKAAEFADSCRGAPHS